MNNQCLTILAATSIVLHTTTVSEITKSKGKTFQSDYNTMISMYMSQVFSKRHGEPMQTLTNFSTVGLLEQTKELSCSNHQTITCKNTTQISTISTILQTSLNLATEKTINLLSFYSGHQNGSTEESTRIVSTSFVLPESKNKPYISITHSTPSSPNGKMTIMYNATNFQLFSSSSPFLVDVFSSVNTSVLSLMQSSAHTFKSMIGITPSFSQTFFSVYNQKTNENQVKPTSTFLYLPNFSYTNINISTDVSGTHVENVTNLVTSKSHLSLKNSNIYTITNSQFIPELSILMSSTSSYKTTKLQTEISNETFYSINTSDISSHRIQIKDSLLKTSSDGQHSSVLFSIYVKRKSTKVPEKTFLNSSNSYFSTNTDIYSGSYLTTVMYTSVTPPMQPDQEKKSMIEFNEKFILLVLIICSLVLIIILIVCLFYQKSRYIENSFWNFFL